MGRARYRYDKLRLPVSEGVENLMPKAPPHERVLRPEHALGQREQPRPLCTRSVKFILKE